MEGLPNGMDHEKAVHRKFPGWPKKENDKAQKMEEMWLREIGQLP